MEILCADKGNKANYMTITAKARKIIEANPYVKEGRKNLEQVRSNSEARQKKRQKKA